MGVNLQYDMVLILFGLFIVSILYSSVGHGGASGYLAVLSLTNYASKDNLWLKQHVWFLNLIVAGIAFYHYKRAGFHNSKLTKPFIVVSIPAAFIGGMLKINGEIYDLLLSFTLIWAAYKILKIIDIKSNNINSLNNNQAYLWGGSIGFFSGIIGVGGGIFLSPIMLMKRWGDVKTVAATASVFIFVNSLSGIIGTGISGQLELDYSLLSLFGFSVIFGGFVGSLYGAKFAPKSRVRVLLSIVLIVAAAKRVFGLF